MRLSFYGAAREVTGSCHCLRVSGKTILIDCGMQQGRDEKPDQAFPFNASDIDYVVVTHAHIDHSGRLPLLVKRGFEGKIYATGATARLMSIMLRDSGHIQEMEAEWKNRKGLRAGKKGVEPLYTVRDAQNVEKLVVSCRYGEYVEVCEGVRIRFVDAGHLLGSAMVEMWVEEEGVSKKIVFSGDVGNLNQPIIRDPQMIAQADYVVMESTYGDRNHEKFTDYTAQIATVIDNTLGRGGNVIIPSFAIGRTQELLYSIREIKERGLVKSRPDFRVYVDSPLANDATRIYDGNLTGYIDEETIEVLRTGQDPLSFDGLYLSQSVEESKWLNEDPTPKVIISSSGMCEAGRIRHHLKHNVWRAECALVFVGYQAAGTLGRALLDGLKTVKLFGEDIAVKCTIYNFRGLSAHADKDGLMRWIKGFETKPERVFVVHGEDEVCDVFVSSLEQEGFSAYAPSYEETYDLLTNALLEAHPQPHGVPSAYQRLLAAGDRLLAAIRSQGEGPTKDFEDLAKQIEALTGKLNA